MKRIILKISAVLMPIFVLSCTDQKVSSEESKVVDNKIVDDMSTGFRISGDGLEKLEDYLVIFDFDDTLYMNGNRDPENVRTGWSIYAEDAINYLHKNGINIAICSKNDGDNLPPTLKNLNYDVFNDDFFTSLAFLDGTPDNTKGSKHCHNPKDQGVKDIIEYYKITNPKYVVMFDDADYNKEDIEGSQKTSSTGVAIKEIGFIQVERREDSSDIGVGGGVTEEKFRVGLRKLGLIESEEIRLLKEGQGDCDNSRECEGNLVCMNPNGEREEANSNDHGFTFKVEKVVTQRGEETCQQPKKIAQEIPLLKKGEGDCDNSKECEGNLVCMNPNGEREEADSNDHGFTFKIENDVQQRGEETCQQPEIMTKSGVVFLEEGEGDCDNSQECAGDLVCMNPNGEREEADSNDHGFTFKIENDVQQRGEETCELPNKNRPDGISTRSLPDVDDDEIKYASDTLVVKSGGSWYFVYCSGQDVKISRDPSKKQTWVKRGDRNIARSNGTKLYCPERGGGYAPTTCKCDSKTENYHEKRKADRSKFEPDQTAPARISTDEEIYIAPNNNMNACLKVLKKKSDGSLRIHSPCALEPWKTKQKCKKEADYNLLLNSYEDPMGSDKNVHNLDCNEFRLNR